MFAIVCLRELASERTDIPAISLILPCGAWATYYIVCMFGLVAFPFFLFIEKSFHVITQLGVWCLWWFNYPGPLLEVELESACLSGQGCGLCIALIRPNHWAASVAQWLEHLPSKQCVSVAQWLEHLPSKQCVVGSNPTRAALFSFRRKKSCLG